MSAERSAIDTIEETIIAAILGAMTLITFANVVVRKSGGNILWAQEVTVFLFAWLVILGASYALKKGEHLGVDAVINAVSAPVRRTLGLIAGACVFAFAFLMFKGAWDFWANFGEFPETTGRWFPTGFEDSFRGKGWYETTSTPMPDLLRFIEGWFNFGEPYDKMPRVVPYVVLPLGMGLFFLRAIQVCYRLFTGRIDRLIVSHEAEDDVQAAAKTLEADAPKEGR